MRLLDFILKKNTHDNEVESKSDISDESEKYCLIEPYIEVTDKNELVRISIITSSIMSGSNTDTKFVVKKVFRRNPELKLLSVISASVMLSENERKNIKLKLKSIKKRKEC